MTGSNNVIIGDNAGLVTTTGTQNTVMGAGTGGTLLTNSNCAVIGHTAEPSSNSVTNEFTLGNSSVDNLRCNDTSISSLSDERDKTNVADLALGVDFLNTVRPVSFDWDRRDGSFVGYNGLGFIAQELKVAGDATDFADHMRLVNEENPDLLEADPMKMFPVLVKAIQELSTENEALLARIVTLENA